MNRVETSRGSTRSWLNCDTGIFGRKTTTSDFRVEWRKPVPHHAGWIPPIEVVQLVVHDEVRGTVEDDGKRRGQMPRRSAPKSEFSSRDQRNPFGPNSCLFGEVSNCRLVRRLSRLEGASRQLPLLSNDVEIDQHSLVPFSHDKRTGGRHCAVLTFEGGVVQSSERHEASASIVIHREFHFGHDRTLGCARSL